MFLLSTLPMWIPSSFLLLWLEIRSKGLICIKSMKNPAMFPFLQKATDSSKARRSSQKVENKSMVFLDFANRYRIRFLFTHDIRYAHILLSIFSCCTKRYTVSTTKKFYKEVMLRNKIMWVTIKYFVATKKTWHQRERLMLTKYVQCWTEMKYMLTK